MELGSDRPGLGWVGAISRCITLHYDITPLCMAGSVITRGGVGGGVVGGHWWGILLVGLISGVTAMS